MKRLIVFAIMTGCAVWSVTAQNVDGRKGLSEQDLAARNAVVTKYDTDGDGVLSKAEQKELSRKDKKTLARTGGVGTARKASRPAEAEANTDETRAGSNAKEESTKADRTGASKPSKPSNNGKGKGGQK